MGTISLRECPFTGMPVTIVPSTFDGWDYSIDINDDRIYIRVHRSEITKIKNYLENKRWLIKALLLNGIWHKELDTYCAILNNLIESNKAIIPSTPKEKKDKILSFFYKQQKYDGETIKVSPDVSKDESYWLRLFFKNRQEFFFYLNLLSEEELLAYFASGPAGEDIVLTGYTILSKGIEYVLNLQEGEYSENCFVAMSFTDEMFRIFDDAIKPAIDATGFKPLIISKEHLSSDTTINDGIIASIKKSRFTIADFTDNRNGVYFEAGFALGRGQKVIYTCKEDHLKNLHFDIRAYQQIVWKDAADFKRKLIDKIEAFIK